MNEEVNISNTDNNSSAEESKESRALKNERRLIEIRRARVFELWSQGLSQPQCAAELHVSQPTINSDIAFLKQQAREQIRSFVTEKLPVTVAKTFVSLDLVTTKLWATLAQAEREGDNKIKLQALSQINQVEAQKIDLVSNLGIVDQITTAAEQRQQGQPSFSSNEENEEPEEEAEAEENTIKTLDEKYSSNLVKVFEEENTSADNSKDEDVQTCQ
jgi:DNA-binding helix-hairpin-helix protein with protein kinase domain